MNTHEIQQIINDSIEKEHISVEELSDGFHTFSQLYQFRLLYNALSFNCLSQSGLFDVHKSWCHHDEQPCFNGEWFIVVAILPDGMISNHYHKNDWDLFKIPEYPTAKYPFDGHTSDDVIQRLTSAIKTM